MDIHYEDVSRETILAVDKLYSNYFPELEHYRDLLLWWNLRVNLISRKISEEIISEHIRHSLFLSALAEFQKESVFIDAGTGGGLPGIPLAITHPEKTFYLNDIAKKKVSAVTQITKELKLHNCKDIHGSIDNINFQLSDVTIISKHAFKLNDLYHHLKNIHWNNILLLKGYPFEDELVSLPEHLYIKAYRLDALQQNDFYQNKCMIVIHQ